MFTFGWEPLPDAHLIPACSTTVEFILIAVGDEIDLALRHGRLPVAHAGEHAIAWALFVGERGRGASVRDRHARQPRRCADP